jgi:hypothetical protein
MNREGQIPEPFFCHPEPFFCHSERSEESLTGASADSSLRSE